MPTQKQQQYLIISAEEDEGSVGAACPLCAATRVTEYRSVESSGGLTFRQLSLMR